MQSAYLPSYYADDPARLAAGWESVGSLYQWDYKLPNDYWQIHPAYILEGSPVPAPTWAPFRASGDVEEYGYQDPAKIIMRIVTDELTPRVALEIRSQWKPANGLMPAMPVLQIQAGDTVRDVQYVDLVTTGSLEGLTPAYHGAAFEQERYHDFITRVVLPRIATEHRFFRVAKRGNRWLVEVDQLRFPETNSQTPLITARINASGYQYDLASLAQIDRWTPGGLVESVYTGDAQAASVFALAEDAYLGNYRLQFDVSTYLETAASTETQFAITAADVPALGRLATHQIPYFDQSRFFRYGGVDCVNPGNSNVLPTDNILPEWSLSIGGLPDVTEAYRFEDRILQTVSIDSENRGEEKRFTRIFFDVAVTSLSHFIKSDVQTGIHQQFYTGDSLAGDTIFGVRWIIGQAILDAVAQSPIPDIVKNYEGDQTIYRAEIEYWLERAVSDDDVDVHAVLRVYGHGLKAESMTKSMVGEISGTINAGAQYQRSSPDGFRLTSPRRNCVQTSVYKKTVSRWTSVVPTIVIGGADLVSTERFIGSNYEIQDESDPTLVFGTEDTDYAYFVNKVELAMEDISQSGSLTSFDWVYRYFGRKIDFNTLTITLTPD